MPYTTVSQPADDGSIYEGKIFGSKGEVVYVIKTSSIKSHQQMTSRVAQTCIRITGENLITGHVAWDNSQYKHARTALPLEIVLTSLRS